MKTLNLESTGLWLGNDGVTYGPFKKIDNFPGKNITLFICLQTELIFNVLGNLVGAKDSQIHKLSENIKLIDNISSDDSDDDLDEVDEDIELDVENYINSNIIHIDDTTARISLPNVGGKITESMILHTNCDCIHCKTHQMTVTNNIDSSLIKIIKDSFNELIESGVKPKDIFISGELPDFSKYVSSFQDIVVGHLFNLMEDNNLYFRGKMKEYEETLDNESILDAPHERILNELGLIELCDDSKHHDIAIQYMVINKINELVNYCYEKFNRLIIIKQNLQTEEHHHLIAIYSYIQKIAPNLNKSEELNFILFDFQFNDKTEEHYLLINRKYNSELGFLLHNSNVERYEKTMKVLPKHILTRIEKLNDDYQEYINNQEKENIKQHKIEKVVKLKHSQDFDKFRKDIENKKSGIFEINVDMGTRFQIKLLTTLIKSVFDKNPEYEHEFIEDFSEDSIGIKYTFKPSNN